MSLAFYPKILRIYGAPNTLQVAQFSSDSLPSPMHVTANVNGTIFKVTGFAKFTQTGWQHIDPNELLGGRPAHPPTKIRLPVWEQIGFNTDGSELLAQKDDTLWVEVSGTLPSQAVGITTEDLIIMETVPALRQQSEIQLNFEIGQWTTSPVGNGILAYKRNRGWEIPSNGSGSGPAYQATPPTLLLGNVLGESPPIAVTVGGSVWVPPGDPAPAVVIKDISPPQVTLTDIGVAGSNFQVTVEIFPERLPQVVPSDLHYYLSVSGITGTGASNSQLVHFMQVDRDTL